MKHPLISRFLIVSLGLVLVSTTLATPAAETTLSPETLAKLRSVLPLYFSTEHPRARVPEVAVTADPNPTGILAPPSLTVQAHTLRRLREDSLYRQGAYDRELVKRELPAFDRCVLNRFTLPLFGIGNEARARQAYFDRTNREFHWQVDDLARVVQLTNPNEAAALRGSLRQRQ